MEKTNFINIITSILLIVTGSAFSIFAYTQGFQEMEDVIFLCIGLLIIVYGVIRLVVTNRVTSTHKD